MKHNVQYITHYNGKKWTALSITSPTYTGMGETEKIAIEDLTLVLSLKSLKYQNWNDPVITPLKTLSIEA